MESLLKTLLGVPTRMPFLFPSARPVALLCLAACALEPVPEPMQATTASCKALRVVNVNSTTRLSTAIAGALPGDSIVLAPGTYYGFWTLRRSGTECHRVYLTGPRDALLRGSSLGSGSALTLADLKYWTVSGFSVTNSLVGVTVRRASQNIIKGLRVYSVGQAGMHIRENSKHNTVRSNTVDGTGKYRIRYGEGIYLGRDAAQWTNGQPDRTDSNLVYGNTLGPRVTADLIDVKSGTTGNIIRKNQGDGSGMVSDPSNPVWVLANGNKLTVDSNIFVNAKTHGIKVRSTDYTWAKGSVVRANTMTVRTIGRAVTVETPNNSYTTVKCNNVRRDTGVLTNVRCVP
jgi:Right handed beta helix region